VTGEPNAAPGAASAAGTVEAPGAVSASVAVTVGRRDEIPSGGGVAVDANGRPVALFDLGGEVVALDGRCRHRGGPIGEGYVRDGIVTCPLHWWRYDIRTGRLVGDPSIGLERFPVEVVDDSVVVMLPPEPPAEPVLSMRERLLRRARAQRDATEPA
jgi:nitrite reductase/ring-hydroxylating ferredoxin subunit